MKWNNKPKLKLYEERVKKRFAFLPTKVVGKDMTIWLEKYYAYQAWYGHSFGWCTYQISQHDGTY